MPSPDGKWVAHQDKDNQLWLLDLTNKTEKKIDVSMHGGTTYELADTLAARGVPFLFCTGIDPRDLNERHRGRPVLTKPYSDADFRAALAKTLG